MGRWFLVSAMAVLVGCTTAEFTPAPGAGVYGAYEGTVRLLDGFPAAGTYERLGIVIARGVRLNEKADLVEDLKTEAAKRGANAIVLQGDVKTRKGTDGAEEKRLAAFALRILR